MKRYLQITFLVLERCIYRIDVHVASSAHRNKQDARPASDCPPIQTKNPTMLNRAKAKKDPYIHTCQPEEPKEKRGKPLASECFLTLLKINTRSLLSVT